MGGRIVGGMGGGHIVGGMTAIGDFSFVGVSLTADVAPVAGGVGGGHIVGGIAGGMPGGREYRKGGGYGVRKNAAQVCSGAFQQVRHICF